MLIRSATVDDVPAIVALLADDGLGRLREIADDLTGYREAFAEIDADPNSLLVVAEDDGVIVGTFQLTFIRYLTYGGGTRAQIEAVRVASSQRGRGLGTEMMRWAIEEARRHGCHLVQLTTNKSRDDAHRFYRSLGFDATHEGMKLHLEPRTW